MCAATVAARAREGSAIRVQACFRHRRATRAANARRAEKEAEVRLRASISMQRLMRANIARAAFARRRAKKDAAAHDARVTHAKAAIWRAAKRRLKREPRPFYVRLVSGSRLRATDRNGVSDPFVYVAPRAALCFWCRIAGPV